MNRERLLNLLVMVSIHQAFAAVEPSKFIHHDQGQSEQLQSSRGSLTGNITTEHMLDINNIMSDVSKFSKAIEDRKLRIEWDKAAFVFTINTQGGELDVWFGMHGQDMSKTISGEVLNNDAYSKLSQDISNRIKGTFEDVALYLRDPNQNKDTESKYAIAKLISPFVVSALETYTGDVAQNLLSANWRHRNGYKIASTSTESLKFIDHADSWEELIFIDKDKIETKITKLGLILFCKWSIGIPNINFHFPTSSSTTKVGAQTTSSRKALAKELEQALSESGTEATTVKACDTECDSRSMSPQSLSLKKGNEDKQSNLNVDALSNQLIAQTNALQASTQKVVELEGLFEYVNTENSTLEDQIAAKKSEKIALEKEVTNLKAEIVEAKKKSEQELQDQLTEKTNEFKAANQKSEAQVADLTTELANATQRLAELDGKVVSANSALADVKSEKAALEAKTSNLEKELAKAQKMATGAVCAQVAATEDAKQKAIALETAKSEKTALETETSKLKEALAAANTQNAKEFAEANQKSEAKVAGLTKELAEAQKMATGAVCAKVHAEQQAEKLTNEKTALETETSKLKEALEAKKSENAVLKTEVEKLKNSMMSVKSGATDSFFTSVKSDDETPVEPVVPVAGDDANPPVAISDSVAEASNTPAATPISDSGTNPVIYVDAKLKSGVSQYIDMLVKIYGENNLTNKRAYIVELQELEEAVIQSAAKYYGELTSEQRENIKSKFIEFKKEKPMVEMRANIKKMIPEFVHIFEPEAKVDCSKLNDNGSGKVFITTPKIQDTPSSATGNDVTPVNPPVLPAAGEGNTTSAPAVKGAVDSGDDRNSLAVHALTEARVNVMGYRYEGTSDPAVAPSTTGNEAIKNPEVETDADKSGTEYVLSEFNQALEKVTVDLKDKGWKVKAGSLRAIFKNHKDAKIDNQDLQDHLNSFKDSLGKTEQKCQFKTAGAFNTAFADLLTAMQGASKSKDD